MQSFADWHLELEDELTHILRAAIVDAISVDDARLLAFACGLNSRTIFPTRNRAMPKISEMFQSKYLTQDDVGTGKLVTITALKKQNLAQEGDSPEYKWTMSFRELDKPLVLNLTNATDCQRFFGSDEAQDWIGHQLVLFVDPTIRFGTKVVGGIRVRLPRQNPTAAAQPAPRPAQQPYRSREDEEFNTRINPDQSFVDDVPF